MKRITFLICLCLMVVLTISASYAADRTTGASGNWSSATTWGGFKPGTGTISFSTASTTVTGTGTLFTSELTVGELVRAKTTGAPIGQIASIANDLSLTLVAVPTISAIDTTLYVPDPLSPGAVPGAGDNAIISIGHSITFDPASATVTTLTINDSASLSFSGAKTLNGDVTIHGVFTQVGGAATISMNGNITCSGPVASVKFGSNGGKINNTGVGKVFTLSNGATLQPCINNGNPPGTGNILSLTAVNMTWVIDNSSALTTVAFKTSGNVTYQNPPNGQVYGNLKFISSSGAGPKNLSFSENLVILGNLSFDLASTTGGTLVAWVYNLGTYKIRTLGSGKSVTVSQLANHDLILAGTADTLFPGFTTYNFVPPSNGNCTVYYGSTTGTQVIFGGQYQKFTLAGGSAKVLLGNASVTDSVTLANGKLTLGSNNLTLASSAGIASASATNYIVADGAGVLTRQAVGATEKAFPVGISTSYLPVSINNAGTADDFSVKVQSSYDHMPPSPPSIVNSQWTVNEGTPGGSNATLKFQWNVSDQASGFNPDSAVKSLRWNGSAWEQNSATVTLGPPHVATTAGITNFSPFLISNAAPAGNYLNGVVYNDVMDDSSVAGDVVQSGWLIKLFKDGSEVMRTTTDINGNYFFSSLYAGTYTIEESLQVNWHQTFPLVGGANVTLTTYGVNAGPRAYEIVVIANSQISGLDFGNYKHPSLSGKIYFDAEGDSSIIGNVPLGGWVVKLYKSGALQGREVSDVNGDYQFSSVSHGTYTVEESLKTDWIQTYPRVTDPGVVDTIFGINAGPRSYTIISAPTVSLSDKDFGNKTITTGGTIVSAGVKGRWSLPATWIGGVVPTAVDNALIANGDTVKYDLVSGGINNLTIGENASVPTSFEFRDDKDYSLTVFGNLTISGDSSILRTQSNLVLQLNHTLRVKGDFTSTGLIDFKTGGSPYNAFINLVLDGNKNTNFTVKPYKMLPDVVNEFADITINKSGGARVILNSDVSISTSSFCVFSLVNGIVETGSNTLKILSNDAAGIIGGSQSSYVYGRLARAWPSSNGVTAKIYPVGDANTYRPVYISDPASSYNLLTVELINGNANTGSSILSSDIGKVSALRYAKVTVDNIPHEPAYPQTSFLLSGSGIGYYANDGVTAGNTNLRVANSYDARANWVGTGPTTHTTVVGGTPTQILSTLSISQSISYGSSFYITLARATGTTENMLDTSGCKDVVVSSGWNMISVPFVTEDMRKTSLFPSAASNAFAFANGYTAKDTLVNGVGYWLKFNTPGNIPVCGPYVKVSNVAVKAGWNMIGIYDKDIQTNQITCTPGIISSQYYGYTNGYQTANTLLSGKAYWVKVSQDGVLNLP
jgi:hypothetical protein